MDFQSIALPSELRYRPGFQSGGKDKGISRKKESPAPDFFSNPTLFISGFRFRVS